MRTNEKIVVRIPPSPTGFFHVGRARTALFNYLFAKKSKGKIIFRIEDTDRERSKEEYEKDIIESLEWLGIKYDEGPERQSEHGEIYKKYIQQLISEDRAYISVENEGQNKEVVRFKNPNRIVAFDDLIRGTITFDSTELGDFIIARNINQPVYHLAVVVDDFNSGITHIIRGDDGIANTPRQILIQEAIGAPRPKYAHVPLILAPDKSKMSARHGAVSLRDFRLQGYLPETMVNFLALLGFNPGGEREVYTLEELVDVFDLSKVQKSGAIFNTEKLDWFNKEHMKLMSEEARNKEIYNRLKNNLLLSKFEKLNDEKFVSRLFPIIFDHISKWGDIDEMVKVGELSYYFERPKYDKKLLFWKGKISDDAKKHLEWIQSTLNVATDNVFKDPGEIKSLIFGYATEHGRGEVLWPLRVALSGKDKSPDPFTLLHIFGREESFLRIHDAIKKL
ncbi:MAG: glutamate--tRNA ligase family protein [Minisyncoccia bacterium]